MRKLLLTIMCVLTLAFSAQAKELTLSADNTLTLSGPVTGSSVGELMQEARSMDANLKSGYPMYLFLYTPGGSIQDGLELIEYLNGLNRPVHTVTLFAASMGWQIAQHLGKRYIVNYGVLMSHNPRGGFSGEFAGNGMPSKLDSYQNLWKRRVDMMDKKTVSRTNGKQTLESYRKAYMFDLWLNGPEAVKDGYADSSVTVKCNSTLVGERTQILDFGFFRIKASFSKCPLNTNPTSIQGLVKTNRGELPIDEFLQKNGKFGSDCRDTAVPESTDYNGNIVPGKKAELCAMDKKLTLKDIRKKIEEVKKNLTRDPRTNIIYSY